jgi:glycerophosphoryl diester phosphodiesterase
MCRSPAFLFWLTAPLAMAGPGHGFEFYEPVRPPRPFQVMVHRGSARQAPENTRSAIEFAVTDGLEWVEVDVRLTRDGRHILLHDDRLDATTDGTGPVKERDLDEIRKVDAGSWFAPRFAGERLLTLEECLKLAKGRINLYLDCKDVKPDLLVRQILEAGMAAQAIVFDRPDNLKRVRELSQGAVAIMPKWHPSMGTAAWVDDLRPTAVEIDATNVTPETCKTFHERGIRVQANVLGQWDRPEYWDKVLAAGADWIQTDLPEELIAHAIWKRLPKRPVRMTCHRGSARYAPENTLPAFAKAIRMGADLIEFDIRPTRDGAFYLLHDSRLDRTTGGKGPIDQCPTEAVARLDAGRWFGRPFAGTRVPSLDALLTNVAGRVDLYCDAKDIPPEALAAALRQHGVINRAVVYQMPDYLARLKAISPGIRTLPPLADPVQLRFLQNTLKPYGVDVPWEMLSKDLIARCHDAGIAVFSDVPSDKTVEDYMQAIRWGIDVIQTDHPLRLVRAVELLTAPPAATQTRPARR